MQAENILTQFSDALATRLNAVQPLVVAIRNSHRHISGLLWQKDVVVTSEQAMGDREEYEIVNAAGGTAKSRIIGRDPGTNILALRLDRSFDVPLLEPSDARAGELVLAVAAAFDGNPALRLGVLSAIGPQWHSRAGGRIDRRITLDIRLGRTEEGGPVLDSRGAVLGMSTLGVAGAVLVIPFATLDRVLPQLLRDGQVARGWLGFGLHPVAVPEPLREAAGQASGMIVMSIAAEGPAARAGVIAGDIVISIDRTPVHNMRTIAAQLDADRIGRPVELRVIRGGELTVLAATVGARPPS